MPGDDKKKEMKKEGDALEKLLKEAEKKLDTLIKLGAGDVMFISMLKMMKMMMKQQNTQMKQMVKLLK